MARTTTNEARSAAADPAGAAKRLAWALRFAVLIVPAGLLLGGPNTWGFDHLAYLSPAAVVLVVLPGALVFLPDRILAGRCDRAGAALARFLDSRGGAMALAALVAALAWTLRTRSHFLGDGYLLLESLGDAGSARPSGSFGFLLTRALAQALGSGTEAALAAFRTVAIGAGVAGFLLVRQLLAATGWSAPARLAFVALHAASAGFLLYCGYVESYAPTLAFLTAFTLAGIGAAAGRLSLRLPSLLLALAVASHLGALLALPALLWLAAIRARPGARGRAFLGALGPVAAVVAALAATLALADSGAGLAVLRGDANLARPLRPLGGEGGLLSARALIDFLNLIVLLAPVPVVALLAAARRRRPAFQVRSADATGGFLAVHGGAVLLAAVLLDPKLGAARDWDLLAPHTAVATALAVRAATSSGASLRRLAAAAVVFAVPWLLLGTDAAGSARRLENVAASFAPYQRGYAFEGLALHHRQAGRFAEAAEMYARAAAAQPGNARFQALHGASLVTLHDEIAERGESDPALLHQAEMAYARALALDDGQPAVWDTLARLRGRRGDWLAAEELLERLARRGKLTADQLQLLLACRVGTGRHGPARVAYERLLLVHPQAPVPASWRAWLEGDGSLPPPPVR